MGRLIPRKTKVKTEFIKGMNLTDALILLFFMVLLGLALMSDFALKIKLILCAGIIMIGIVMFLQIAPDTRSYQLLANLFAHMFMVKKFKKQKIIVDKVIEKAPFISFGRKCKQTPRAFQNSYKIKKQRK